MMQFGLATCDIVPPFSTTMGGYGMRNDPFDSVHDPLRFTALVMESAGRRVMLGAADIIGFADDGRTEMLLDRIGSLLGIEPAQIMLNASHTHGGPKMPEQNLFANLYGSVALAEQYADWLAERILQTVAQAANSLQPGTLHHACGRTALPMNRRKRVDGNIVNAPNPQGPVDDSLHLLALKDADNQLAAVLMRVSCHPVAAGPQYSLTGDFVGGWKQAFEQTLGPSVTPMFLQGAGGDMRPRHAADGDRWRCVPLAEMLPIGRELLAEMLNALDNMTPMDELIFQGRTKIVSVPCEGRYTNEVSVRTMLGSTDYLENAYAHSVIDMLQRGEAVPSTSELRVQSLWLDENLALVGLNCEPLIGLGRIIEQAFAPKQAMVLGYTNGCVCYAPDSEALAQGGYETESYLMGPWSGPWVQGFERSVIPQMIDSLRDFAN